MCNRVTSEKFHDSENELRSFVTWNFTRPSNDSIRDIKLRVVRERLVKRKIVPAPVTRINFIWIVERTGTKRRWRARGASSKVESNLSVDGERYSTAVLEKNKRTQIVLVTVFKFAMPTLLRLTSRVLVHGPRAKKMVRCYKRYKQDSQEEKLRTERRKLKEERTKEKKRELQGEKNAGEVRRNEDNEKKAQGRKKWNVKDRGERKRYRKMARGVHDSTLVPHFYSVFVRWLVPFVSRRSKTAIFFLPRRICGGTKGIACISLVAVARELRLHFHPALIVLDLVNTFPEYSGKCY